MIGKIKKGRGFKSFHVSARLLSFLIKINVIAKSMDNLLPMQEK